MNDIIQQLAPYLVSIVIGGLTYLITYLKTKTINLKVETLEKLFKDSDEEYIIYCPNCNTKILLSEAKIVAHSKAINEEEEE